MKRESDLNCRETPMTGPSLKTGWAVTRRDFLRVSACTLAGLAIRPTESAGAPAEANAGVRFGIVTDAHYADGKRGTRFYSESLDKMAECVELMNEKKVDFLVELGDFKDQDSPAVEEKTLAHLKAIENVFGRFEGARYHVLGNHDVDSISKEQFVASVKNTGVAPNRTYYSFESGGMHFIVLDANFKTDGSAYDRGNFQWTDANIPPAELKWLKEDLASADKPTIVFSHQLLDGEGAVYVNNAEEVRAVLQDAGKVLAVFQGHHHIGQHRHLQGIHHYTLKAMVENSGPKNSAYAVVDVDTDGNVTVTGYRRAESKELANATSESSTGN